MTQKQEILTRLKNKTAIIGIMGLGYVGLPLALRFAEVGFKVLGFDIDINKVSKLNKQESYIAHIPSERLAKVKNNISATTDFSNVKEADALILCVPTPLNKWREPDLSYIESTMNALLPFLRPGHIVSLESTTYPGNTEEMLKPMVESKGFEVGKDVFVVYSPEREDPGNAHFGTSTIPKVCSGISENCREVAIALYEQVVNKVVPVSSTRAAEMTKLLENIHRAVNIGLVNEMKIVADKMDIDIFEVINAAATKPFGFVAYHPGPGIGGHCIPIDPFYMTWKAREFGLHTRFIELAGEINSYMPKWVVNKVTDGLNRSSKSVKGSKILVLGVAYKMNVDDMRESPSLELMELLLGKGAHVSYSDPHVPTIPPMRHHDLHQNSVALTAEELSKYDCVIVATAHDAFDFEFIKNNSKLIVDTRGIYTQRADHIIKA